MFEVCKKTMGPGGFMHMVQRVMKRPKLIDAAFGNKKFQHQNLNRIDEAVRDGCMAYGLAAVQQFRNSDMFPSKEVLEQCEKEHGNHHDLLLSSFKKWIQKQKSMIAFQ